VIMMLVCLKLVMMFVFKYWHKPVIRNNMLIFKFFVYSTLLGIAMVFMVLGVVTYDTYYFYQNLAGLL